MKKVMILILFICTLSIYASSYDQLFIKIKNSEIAIRWSMDLDDFYNSSIIFDIIELMAPNYKMIENQRVKILINCFTQKDGYGFYYARDGQDGTNIVFKNFSELHGEIIKKLKKELSIDFISSDSFYLYVLALPVNSQKQKLSDYTNFSEIYFGPAPGIMQEIINDKLYYKYMFFSPLSMVELLNKVTAIQGVVIKKEIVSGTPDKIFDMNPPK